MRCTGPLQTGCMPNSRNLAEPYLTLPEPLQLLRIRTLVSVWKPPTKIDNPSLLETMPKNRDWLVCQLWMPTPHKWSGYARQWLIFGTIIRFSSFVSSLIVSYKESMLHQKPTFVANKTLRKLARHGKYNRSVWFRLFIRGQRKLQYQQSFLWQANFKLKFPLQQTENY